MKKTLIALVAIAAGVVAADAPAVERGAKFEAEEGTADQLIAKGDAKLFEETKPTGKSVKARVLVDSAFGNANDVVQLDEASAKAAVDQGVIDTNKSAVAYAEDLARKARAAAAEAAGE